MLALVPGMAVAAASVVAAEPAPVTAEAALLDAQTQEFSARFFAQFVRAEHRDAPKSMDAVKRALETYRAGGDAMQATATVSANLEVIEKNIDASEALAAFDLLLKANEWKGATRLYERISGGQSDRAAASFLLAQHYFARNRWDMAAKLLEGVGAELAADETHRARLLHGIALQRLRKHRAALAQYAKIPATSRHYATARLNMAIANIRQDWWTDAHTIMRELLKSGGIDVEFADRVYTVWGYSLLRQQYFRHARDTFRNVRLDGAHTNKALLGIALSAAYQNDYVGALNAITVLKARTPAELSVDEAHLLMPYVYEKLAQRTTATAGYAQAVTHYEQRIAAIEKAEQTSPAVMRERLLAADGAVLAVEDERVDLEDALPAAFFGNLKLLAAFRPHLERIGDAALKREYSALDARYTAAVQRAVTHALREKRGFIDHYMSQARFGLAAIDDNVAGAQ